MDINFILYLGRHTLETALLVASPLLLVCVFSGLAVSIFQTVTSLRDMTLTMVPKLFAICIATMFFGNWMMQVLIRFTLEIFNLIQSYGQ
jgi:flagellar biosynthetic protein FliQ